jgi:hypothetical protein
MDRLALLAKQALQASGDLIAEARGDRPRD